MSVRQDDRRTLHERRNKILERSANSNRKGTKEGLVLARKSGDARLFKLNVFLFDRSNQPGYSGWDPELARGERGRVRLVTNRSKLVDRLV